MISHSRQITMRTVVAVILGVFLVASLAGAQQYPEKLGLVNDYAGVLNPGQRRQLEGICLEASRKASIQVSIVTMEEIPEGQAVSAYAVELGHHWGVGRKGQDRGALLLFKTTQPRNIYLATGYGLEGDINDAKAGRILDQVTIPLIQQGKMVESFAATVATIVKIVEPDVQLTGAPAPRQMQLEEEPLWTKVIGLIVMFIIFLVMMRSPFGRSMLFGMLLGSMLGGGRRGGWGGGGGGSFGGGFGGFGGGGFGGGGAGRGGF